MSLRFKISVVAACTTSFVMFLCSFVLLTGVREKQIHDLAELSSNLAQQLSSSPMMRAYFEEQADAPKERVIEQYLQTLVEGNPFVEELTLMDKFGKMPFRIVQSRKEPKDSPTYRASLSIQKVLNSGKPSFVEESWEYFVPISLHSSSYWGVLRLRWKPEATGEYFHALKRGAVYASSACLILSFLLAYFVLLRAYVNEHHRLAKTLSLITGGDVSQRIDTQTYSRGIVEIGTYLNRILMELEEEKKNSVILNSTLRDTEKGFMDYRKALGDKSSEIETLRQELTNGLRELFDLLWCGVLVIDDEYRIHYMNEQAGRLLRFARFDEETLLDDRLRKCLSPLVRLGTVQRLDDLCAWPQPSLGRAVACRVRSSAIPTGDGSRLYFVLLREESGFPKQRNFSYFAERLIFDVLLPKQIVTAEPVGEGALLPYTGEAMENRMQMCFFRIGKFRDFEKGRFGPVVTIRLGSWLKDHFSDYGGGAEDIQVSADSSDMEITLTVPEEVLLMLIGNAVELIADGFRRGRDTAQKALSIRASLDSRGKPNITLSVSPLSRKDASYLSHVFEERVEGIGEGIQEDFMSLEQLEQDLRISFLQYVKRILRVHVECVYSDNKQLATFRMTIDRHVFPIIENDPDSPPPSSDAVRDLVREYLGKT